MDHEKNQDRWGPARYGMVNKQIFDRGVCDDRVLEAMRRVPRHEFVPISLTARAYDDTPLRIGEGQTISQPYIVGLMTELLRISNDDRVLEVGTGSGYQTAVLAELARTVFTAEIRGELAQRACFRLEKMGYKNINFRVSDGSAGWPEAAPFDCIVVTAGACSIPPKLVEQLRPGGRMVIPVGDQVHGQSLQLVTKHINEAIDIQDTVPVRFVGMVLSRGGAEDAAGS